MSDIIKKFKKSLVKKSSLTRNSYGKHHSAFLFCYTKNNVYYSKLIFPLRKFEEENFPISSSNPGIFKESLFEGEYYNGVFYITKVIFCPVSEINMTNVVTGIGEDSEYTYSFDISTYSEKWTKKTTADYKKKIIIKDHDFIEIYRIKETNEIIRIKNIEISKKLKNFFNNFQECDIDLKYNDRFKKWEVVL